MHIFFKILLLTILGLVSVGIYFLDSFTLQFFSMALVASIFFIAMACIVKNIIFQYAAIILFSICITITGFEFYFAPSSSTKAIDQNVTKAKPQALGMSAVKYTLSPHDEHKELGYVLKPSISVNGKRDFVHSDGKKDIVYDVTYTTNELGNRITPTHANAKTAVVLFGCSFTLGEGINDKETFAYKLGESLGENYQVINLGVGGYGTHHIYSIIQSQIPYLEQYEHIIAYYIALRTHRERAAGLSPWDALGPRYTITNGKVERDGNFLKQYPYNATKLLTFLNKSHLYKRYHNQAIKLLIPFNSDAKRNHLLNALTIASVNQFKATYPQSTFSILAWDDKTINVLDELPKDISIFNITSWFPDYKTKPELYEIKYDKHPNALANSIIAKHITTLVKNDEKKLNQVGK